MTFDRHSLHARLVSLVLAVVMPLCCCTVQTLGAWSLGDHGVESDRPACCCVARSTCDESPSEDEPADEGCHCLRAAPVDIVDHAPLLGRLALPPDVLVPTTVGAIPSPVRATLMTSVVDAGPPPDVGPPDTSPRLLRRAIIIQV